MIEVIIDSIRVSLMAQHRVVILKDISSERYLPIWIGPCEADAITAELKNMTASRPMTHDLLKSVINEMGAEVEYIVVNNLQDDIFFAQVVLGINGKQITIDARPSDAIALAVRARVPIYVEDEVMDKAAVIPDEGMEATTEPQTEDASEEGLGVFQDFLDTLDLDDLENSE